MSTTVARYDTLARTTSASDPATEKQEVDRPVRNPSGVRPSKVSADASKPFTLEQELEPFAKWTSRPIYVPPKGSSTELAESMLRTHGALQSKQDCWQGVVDEHRSSFTEVREIELVKASIRLPKAKLYVTVTQQKDFDQIEDPVPACVQTRLDEFLQGPGRRKGVKVVYLKPLCIEMDDKLIFTTSESLQNAICKVQDEVFAEYRRLYLRRRPVAWAKSAAKVGTAIPKGDSSIYGRPEAADHRRLRGAT